MALGEWRANRQRRTPSGASISAMYVVAIAELSASGGALGELATELGTTLYELKLTLNAGLPAIVVLTVADRHVQGRS